MGGVRGAAQPNGWSLFRIVVALLALAAAGTAPVFAEDEDPDEHLIGTIIIGDPRDADDDDGAGTPASPEIPGGQSQALFNEALADLGVGRLQSAERLFERIVAREPDGALAQKARGYLADLYRGYAGSTAPATAPSPGAPKPTAFPDRPAARAPDAPRQPVLPREANLRPVPEPPAKTPVPETVAMRFIVEAGDRIFFSAGSAQLGGRARSVLAAQARFMKRRPDLVATIEGHADDGAVSPAQQMELSRARAEIVRQRLIEEGVEEDRIDLVALARQRPVSDCPSPECAAQNRRAVTVLSSRGGVRAEESLVRPAGTPVAAGRSPLPTQ